MDFEVANNLEFYKEMSAIEFIRDIGITKIFSREAYAKV